jgi:hypothetical protein
MKNYIGPKTYKKAVNWLTKYLGEIPECTSAYAEANELKILRTPDYPDYRMKEPVKGEIYDVTGSETIILKSDESGSGYYGGEINSILNRMKDDGIIEGVPFVSATTFHCAGVSRVNTADIINFIKEKK